MKNHFGKVSSVHIQTVFKDGKNVLEEVSFTAPYKIMTPFQREDGGISIMPLSASAGIMSGDVQEFSYRIGEKCNVEILSQAFEKIHKMEQGGAKRNIEVSVAKNATLCYFPQPVIPFAESEFDSVMKVRLEDMTSRFFLLDVLSSGRVAYGEQFAYRRFASKIEIFRETDLIYRDNARYEPHKMEMRGIGMFEGFTHIGNMFCTGLPEDICTGIIEILEQSEMEYGISKTAFGDLVIRLFGMRAQRILETADEIKNLFHSSCVAK